MATRKKTAAKKTAAKKLTAIKKVPAPLPTPTADAPYYGSRLVSRAEAAVLCAKGWHVRADHGSSVRVACCEAIWKATGGR